MTRNKPLLPTLSRQREKVWSFSTPRAYHERTRCGPPKGNGDSNAQFRGRAHRNQAGWEGAIIAQADTDTPCIEFTNYREIPIIVDLNVENLEVVWEIRP
jgi:hypothetical protein